MYDKKLLLIISGLTILGLLGFVFWQTKPRPGQLIDDLGRGHIPLGTEQKYNSNPPTSGPHYEEWVKAGIYERPQDDRYLIHSLEHGYVILSYNCNYQPKSLVKTAFAHGIEDINLNGTDVSTSSAIPDKKTSTEDLPAVSQMTSQFESEECHNLVDRLISIYESKGKKKLIIVPRPSLDTKVGLTAWRYLDKMANFDKKRIEKFIDGNRDRGPEKTVE